MEENNSWIKLHRKLLKNPRMRNPNYLAVWIWLLLHAEWQDGREVIFNNERIVLKKGQVTCGVHQIAEDTGVPKSTVGRMLGFMKCEKQIGKQSSNKFSLITVNNWDKYQGDGNQNGKRMGNEWETNGKRMGTIKEEKEYKEEKELKNEPKETTPQQSQLSTNEYVNIAFQKISEVCKNYNINIQFKIFDIQHFILEYKLSSIEEITRQCCIWLQSRKNNQLSYRYFYNEIMAKGILKQYNAFLDQMKKYQENIS